MLIKLILFAVIAVLFVANEYYLYKNKIDKKLKSINIILTSTMLVIINNIVITDNKIYIDMLGTVVIIGLILLVLVMILIMAIKNEF